MRIVIDTGVLIGAAIKAEQRDDYSTSPSPRSKSHQSRSEHPAALLVRFSARRAVAGVLEKTPCGDRQFQKHSTGSGDGHSVLVARPTWQSLGLQADDDNRRRRFVGHLRQTSNGRREPPFRGSKRDKAVAGAGIQ